MILDVFNFTAKRWNGVSTATALLLTRGVESWVLSPPEKFRNPIQPGRSKCEWLLTLVHSCGKRMLLNLERYWRSYADVATVRVILRLVLFRFIWYFVAFFSPVPMDPPIYSLSHLFLFLSFSLPLIFVFRNFSLPFLRFSPWVFTCL